MLTCCRTVDPIFVQSGSERLGSRSWIKNTISYHHHLRFFSHRDRWIALRLFQQVSKFNTDRYRKPIYDPPVISVTWA